MTSFNNKISTVRFTNEEHDTIEVVYDQSINDTPDFVTHYLEVDFSHPDFLSLEESGWDLERIQKFTISYNQQQGEAWREIVKFHAAEDVKGIKEDFNNKIENMKEEVVKSSAIIKAVISNNDDEETVFKAKLEIFELDAVKSLKDRNKKMSIRKSKSLLELLSNLNEIYNTKD